ncbi:MAG: AI-2E family transporter [bacterium]|nr:AI-2E family transporter [bacterium]
MPAKEHQIIEISFSTMLKAAFLIILLWLTWTLRDIISIILVSIVIASSIEPMNHWFARFGVPRVLGVIIIYLGGFMFLSAIVYLIIPPLLGDIIGFLGGLPNYIADTLGPNGPIYTFFPGAPTAFGDIIRSLATLLENQVEAFSRGVLSVSASFFGGMVSFALLIVISFYLSVQERGIENFLRIVTPLKHEEYILDLWQRSQRKIGRWLQGQMLLGVLVGVMVFLGLTILDVKYAILLAILSAVFEIIPIFGPIMAALPAVAIAWIQRPFLGLMVLLLYIVVQQFENHLIYPLVVRKTVGVPPLLAIISLVVGAQLGGLIGVILSVPFAVVLVEFLNDVAARKQPKIL